MLERIKNMRVHSHPGQAGRLQTLGQHFLSRNAARAATERLDSAPVSAKWYIITLFMRGWSAERVEKHIQRLPKGKLIYDDEIGQQHE